VAGGGGWLIWTSGWRCWALTCTRGSREAAPPPMPGVPARTARRWLTAYEAEGAAGLARISRTDRGSHRVSAEMRTLIEGLALRRPPPRMAEVHRAAVKIAEDKDWPAPSYWVVSRIIAGLDRGLVSLAQHGRKGVRERVRVGAAARVGPPERSVAGVITLSWM